MAQSRAQLIAQLIATIFPNTNQEIDAQATQNLIAEIINSTFNLVDDASASNAGGVISVSTIPVIINFSTPITNYDILPFCYDSNGQPVGFSITSRSANGFTVTAAANGTFVYQIVMV
jgi:hypothetical protein